MVWDEEAEDGLGLAWMSEADLDVYAEEPSDELEDGLLTIQGERQFTSESSEQQYHRVDGLHYLLLVPLSEGRVISVAVPLVVGGRLPPAGACTMVSRRVTSTASGLLLA